MLLIEVSRAVKLYLMSRDTKALDDVVALVEAEKATPSLQRAVLSLDDMTYNQMIAKLHQEPVIKFSLNDVTDLYLEDPDEPGSLEEGKLIRVVAQDQPEGSAFVLKVVHLDFDNIVLWLPGGDMHEGDLP